MRNRTSIIRVVAGVVLALLAMACTALAAPKPGSPALITSAGQSTDGLILKTILTNRATGETVPFEKLAKPENLTGVRTLIVSVGLSTKGLGAAGINADQEKARIRSLLDAAKKNDIYVVLVHIGGTSRRGAGSDDLARMVGEYAHHIMVIKASNDDGFFTRMSQEKKIPIAEVADRTALGPVITDLLNAK